MKIMKLLNISEGNYEDPYIFFLQKAIVELPNIPKEDHKVVHLFLQKEIMELLNITEEDHVQHSLQKEFKRIKRYLTFLPKRRSKKMSRGKRDTPHFLQYESNEQVSSSGE